MRSLMIAALGLVAMTGLPADAATIAFSDQTTGMLAGSFSTADATFTSSTGSLYFGAAGGDSAICAYSLNSCAGTVTVDFAGPISNLSFLVDGDNSAASSLFISGTAASGSFSFTAGGFDGDVHTASLVTLSQFEGITSLTLTSNDLKGLGYDHFDFEPALTEQPGSGATVPEPAAWALMLTGLGLVGGAMRRRSRGMVTA